MLDLQDALVAWFEQFIGKDRVRIIGEDRLEDGGMDVSKFPIIVISYATSDFDENTMLQFDIWTYSLKWGQVKGIENLIAKALPSQTTEMLQIKSADTISEYAAFEYLEPSTGEWIEFDIADVRRIAQDIRTRYNQDLEWRETTGTHIIEYGEPIGAIALRRGNPFTTSIPDVDFMVKRRRGNIVVKSFAVY